jgi:hypothetical protein
MSILKVNTIQDKGGNNLLVSDGAGTISSGGLMTMTPSFYVTLSANQVVSNGTNTKIQYDNVIIDTNSCWDSSNYRFTPTVAGKYFVFGTMASNGAYSGTQYQFTRIYKNGSVSTSNGLDFRNNAGGFQNATHSSGIFTMNGSTDYIEVYGNVQMSSGTSEFDGDSTARTYMYGYKIIGA